MTTGVAELIERLTAFAVIWRAHGWTDEARANEEAADLLSRQNMEIERLRGALIAIEKTTFIGVTAHSDDTRIVALESAHDIANEVLGTPSGHMG